MERITRLRVRLLLLLFVGVLIFFAMEKRTTPPSFPS